MNIKKINYSILSLIIAISGLAMLLVGSTYAIFQTTLTSTKTQLIKAGVVTLELIEPIEGLNLGEVAALSDSRGLVQNNYYDFKLKNTGDTAVVYKILLEDDEESINVQESPILDEKYIKIGLEVNGVETGPFNLKDINRIINEGILLKDTTNEYRLRIWLDFKDLNEEEIVELAGYKVFLKLKVTAEQYLDEIEEKSIEFVYKGEYQEFVVPKTGYYEIELWGASGASSSLFAGGKGGYTKGTIHLDKGDIIYLYIGGKGTPSTNTTTPANGGYNGGGASRASSNTNYSMGSGGGSTDIRYFNGTNPGSAILTSWNDISGLRSRIMVASGGGGAGQYNSSGSFGGIGGGLIGGSTSTNTQSTGGTQIAGGTGRYAAGTFGSGAGSTTSSSCGAGGGYYGGGADSYEWGAAGGSSYISGYAGVSGVTSSSSTTATYQTNHYSGKYFINPRMETGVNEGDGEAKITYLGTTIPVKTNTKLNNVRYIKSCINGNSINANNNWLEIQAIKDGVNLAKGKTIISTTAQNASYPYTNLVSGNISITSYATSGATGLQCVTVDLSATYDLDEVGLWLYYADGRKYNDNTLSVGATSTSGTTPLSTIMHSYPWTSGYTETSEGIHYSAYKEYEIPKPKTNTKLNSVQYIKSCINGSNINAASHWVEIMAMKDGENIARGKTVTGTTAQNASYPYSNIVDGNTDSSNYGNPVAGTTGLQCVTVDLGAKYDLDGVGLWLYYLDGRKYNDNTLSVGATSTSGTTSLSTIMHSYAGTTGYNETSDGKKYTAWN